MFTSHRYREKSYHVPAVCDSCMLGLRIWINDFTRTHTHTHSGIKLQGAFIISGEALSRMWVMEIHQTFHTVLFCVMWLCPQNHVLLKDLCVGSKHTCWSGHVMDMSVRHRPYTNTSITLTHVTLRYHQLRLQSSSFSLKNKWAAGQKLHVKGNNNKSSASHVSRLLLNRSLQQTMTQ